MSEDSPSHSNTRCAADAIAIALMFAALVDCVRYDRVIAVFS